MNVITSFTPASRSLRLRRNDTVFNTAQLKGVDGAVLSPDAFLLRYFGDEVDTRILIINFGVDLWLSPAPEPLLAPPHGMDWEIYGRVKTIYMEVEAHRLLS